MSDAPTPAGPQPEQQPYFSEAEGREVADIVGRLDDEGLSKAERAKQLVALSKVVGSRTRRAGASAIASGRVLADLLLEAVPHLPIRDLETLSAKGMKFKHPGGELDPDLTCSDCHNGGIQK